MNLNGLELMSPNDTPKDNLGQDQTYFNLSPEKFFNKNPKLLGLKITEDEFATRLWIPEVSTPLNIYKDTGNLRVYLDTPDDQKKILYLLKIGALGKTLAEHPIIEKSKIENQRNEDAKKYIDQKNSNALPNFPSSDIINTHGKSPRITFQHSQDIIKQPKEGEGIYTFGAGPCAIVILTDRTTGQIGLAHFDSFNTEAQIRQFITSAGFPESEINILSGEEHLMYKIVHAIPDKTSIQSMNADLKGDRNDAAGVFIQNGKPQIVYGLRQDWLPR